MPGRQSHGRAPTKKPKAQKVNSKKRSQDAFAIASEENPDKLKSRRNRLGVSEGGNRPGKRSRNDGEDDEDEEESSTKKQRKSAPKDRFDELDIDEGSDSEGNEWKMGQVDSDDDSDLDSDEAFGESDEERFEGYAFSGSSNTKSKKKRSSNRDVNLDEEDVEQSDSELEEGDLGEDAIDLAAMLDATEEDDEMVADVGDNSEDEKSQHRKSKAKPADSDDDMEDSGSEEESEDESEDSDDESSMSSADEDPSKHAALQALIANLPQVETTSKSSRHRADGVNEQQQPSDAPIKLGDLADLIGLKTGKQGKKKVKELNVPIAKRQQDRLDRSAAYEKTKETLERWTDTVAHNRRAEHLMFPLPNPDGASHQASNARLLPTTTAKPFNELEATIQSILEESGLAPINGKDDEDRLREYEELETKKMSVEEVKARRDQLRMARELMFREEAKAKRIKKIKSKSYRKVHRKQREKEERQNKEALLEGGFEPSEDELEAQDRRRATERMGSKHRGSKWAKETKQTGRAAWDEDARAGITDMARRDEELRKRVEGRSARREDDFSGVSSSESEDDGSEDDEAEEQRKLLRQLNNIGTSDLIDESLPGARLANMKFMRNAAASRRKENDVMVEDIRRELAGEDKPSDDEEDQDIGRRMFGPGSKAEPVPGASDKVNQFEEPLPSDEEGDDLEIHGVDNSNTEQSTKSKPKKNGITHSLQRQPLQKEPEPSSGGAWSKVPLKKDVISKGEAKKRKNKNDAMDVELDLSQAAVISKQPKAKKHTKKSTTTLEVESEDDSDDDNTLRLPFAIKDQELIKRAFAGADVVGEFEAEKKQTIEDEDEKVVDNTLPGWGSWVGDGVSKREKQRHKGRFLTKTEGIKEKDRKDAKLERVIINQKRVKKNGKYLASNLPHQFETRVQYERSLRLPVGPEWTTKETFQEATKPRVMLKQGIIAPMSKPMA
ncbi:hypothetical protein BP5796_00379 [Coleophoma crateriformis]|uniref:Utp14-domain-containing protein n=1 Tax=Coleophoma crateriformis TaxID=565419 RepID=A0A3D8T7U2_9HELO|nr:hypothetical protein BP5796_00379 [Coleophoma crateriformis]